MEIDRAELVESASLGVSEVITNALLHAEQPVKVRLRGTLEHPRIEVRDGSKEPPACRTSSPAPTTTCCSPSAAGSRSSPGAPAPGAPRSRTTARSCGSCRRRSRPTAPGVQGPSPRRPTRPRGHADRRGPRRRAPDRPAPAADEVQPPAPARAAPRAAAAGARPREDYPLASSLSTFFTDLDTVFWRGMRDDRLAAALLNGAASLDLVVTVPRSIGAALRAVHGAARPRRRVLPAGAAADPRPDPGADLVPELDARRVRPPDQWSRAGTMAGPRPPPAGNRSCRDPTRPGSRRVAGGGSGRCPGRHRCGGGWATLVPDGTGFPWTTFAINVSGSLALALLPLVAMVRARPALAVGLGPGLLGGYTTLSTYAEQGRGAPCRRAARARRGVPGGHPGRLPGRGHARGPVVERQPRGRSSPPRTATSDATPRRRWARPSGPPCGSGWPPPRRPVADRHAAGQRGRLLRARPGRGRLALGVRRRPGRHRVVRRPDDLLGLRGADPRPRRRPAGRRTPS